MLKKINVGYERRRKALSNCPSLRKLEGSRRQSQDAGRYSRASRSLTAVSIASRRDEMRWAPTMLAMIHNAQNDEAFPEDGTLFPLRCWGLWPPRSEKQLKWSCEQASKQASIVIPAATEARDFLYLVSHLKPLFLSGRGRGRGGRVLYCKSDDVRARRWSLFRRLLEPGCVSRSVGLLLDLGDKGSAQFKNYRRSAVRT